MPLTAPSMVYANSVETNNVDKSVSLDNGAIYVQKNTHNVSNNATNVVQSSPLAATPPTKGPLFFTFTAKAYLTKSRDLLTRALNELVMLSDLEADPKVYEQLDDIYTQLVASHDQLQLLLAESPVNSVKYYSESRALKREAKRLCNDAVRASHSTLESNARKKNKERAAKRAQGPASSTSSGGNDGSPLQHPTAPMNRTQPLIIIEELNIIHIHLQ